MVHALDVTDLIRQIIKINQRQTSSLCKSSDERKKLKLKHQPFSPHPHSAAQPLKEIHVHGTMACKKTSVTAEIICRGVKTYYPLYHVCFGLLLQGRHVWKVDGLMSKSLCEGENSSSNWNSLCFL